MDHRMNEGNLRVSDGGGQGYQCAEVYWLFSDGEFRFQWMVFGKATDTKHAEAQDMARFIHTLHDGIMRSRSHEAWSLPKLDFQVIGFRVEQIFTFSAIGVLLVSADQ